MTDWEGHDEAVGRPEATSLPTPKDTPYRTPSRTSKMSRRSVTPPSKGPSSPPPPSHNDRKDKSAKRASRDVTIDETVSILDPRRFTPTLHANLVSEILALRRDQDEKNKLIESLENSLSATREQQEDAQANSVANSKENRSLKRQLALLEGGTSSALGELARERDEAIETTTETKKRLDAAQKKIRSQEDDSERVHDLWARDKDSWEEERRKFERKVHVAESRLKVVLDELAAYQADQMNGGPHGHDSEVEESGKENNDAGSVRSMSMTNSVRFSVLHGGGPGKPEGNTLADELDLDDEDSHFEMDGRESAFSNRTGHRHTRTMSRDSVASRRHLRNQSLESLRRPGSVSRGKLFMNESVLEALEGEEDVEPTRVHYVDTGVQFTPPPSPKMTTANPEAAAAQLKAAEAESSSPRRDLEIEANQRRKRVQITPPVEADQPPPPAMVSSSSQTLDVPLSPPGTPTSATEMDVPEIVEPSTTSTSTQTEEVLFPSPHERVSLSPSPPPIPSISIQPPTSRPTTPRESKLPPHFKHFGCQVNLSSPPSVSRSNAGVQTEGIKIDQRLAQLPSHLQPSSISSRPSSPVPARAGDSDQGFSPDAGVVPPRNPRRLQAAPKGMKVPASPTLSQPEPDEPHDAYPGNNDDGPLSLDKAAPIKRPHRFSSLFAGFDTASSDEGEFGDDDVSDSEFRTALSAPRPQSLSGRPGALSPTETVATSPEQYPRRQSTRGNMAAASTAKPIGTQVYSSFSLAENKEHQGNKHMSASHREHERGSAFNGPSNRASVMRKAAMIQNGIATHSVRSRSPSLPDTRNPPFPIPTRFSSRRTSTSAPTSEGRRSPTLADGWHRRNGRANVYRSNSIRKVRSAAALPRNQRYRRQGSRSPPPLSPSTEAPESPGLPPLPSNDLTAPRPGRRGSSQYRRHRNKLSTNTENTNNTNNTNHTNNTNNTLTTDPASATSGGQTTSVVDAIAQTMIGEWMFKYVRRRKSFNVPENNGKDDTGNDRHKRWVWLAPYERSILWSSKQPSSGSALMGKTGRKRKLMKIPPPPFDLTT